MFRDRAHFEEELAKSIEGMTEELNKAWLKSERMNTTNPKPKEQKKAASGFFKPEHLDAVDKAGTHDEAKAIAHKAVGPIVDPKKEMKKARAKMGIDKSKDKKGLMGLMTNYMLAHPDEDLKVNRGSGAGIHFDPKGTKSPESAREHLKGHQAKKDATSVEQPNRKRSSGIDESLLPRSITSVSKPKLSSKPPPSVPGEPGEGSSTSREEAQRKAKAAAKWMADEADRKAELIEANKPKPKPKWRAS